MATFPRQNLKRLGNILTLWLNRLSAIMGKLHELQINFGNSRVSGEFDQSSRIAWEYIDRVEDYLNSLSKIIGMT